MTTSSIWAAIHLKEQLDLSVSMVDMFQFPTVSQLAKPIEIAALTAALDGHQGMDLDAEMLDPYQEGYRRMTEGIRSAEPSAHGHQGLKNHIGQGTAVVQNCLGPFSV